MLDFSGGRFVTFIENEFLASGNEHLKPDLDLQESCASCITYGT